MTDTHWLCPSCFKSKATDLQECPHCSFKESKVPADLYLRYRTEIDDRFITGRILGKGTRSVIYLAQEKTTGELYALKEYFPRKMAQRRTNGYVSPLAERRQQFAEGVQVFQEEWELLKGLDHPSIVKCHEALETNGTAYLVMDFYGFETLEAFCQGEKQSVSESDAVKLMLPILNALEVIHGEGLLHCDVNPSNILLPPQKPAVLVDFGSAQLQDGHRPISRPLTFTAGYSAPEQHNKQTNRYRSWTDVYACAATLYRLTTGRIPPPAPARTPDDPFEPLKTKIPSISDNFSRAITRGLSLNPDARPSTVQEFRGLLGSNANASSIVTVVHPGLETTWADRAKQRVVGLAPLAILLLALLSVLYFVLRPIDDRSIYWRPTSPSSVVWPKDFYVLRDVSSSIRNQSEYDLVEEFLINSIRLGDEADESADFTGYAHFAAWVRSGLPNEQSTLHAAARGDNIKGIKARLMASRPPEGFLDSTHFGTLFEVVNSVVSRGEGIAPGQARESVVAVITDGRPDIEGNKPTCADLASHDRFFDQLTEEKLVNLLKSRVHILMLLIGGYPDCTETNHREWERLKREIAPKIAPYQGRIDILSLDGYQDDHENLRDLILRTLRRDPYVSVRPAYTRLEDDQRWRLETLRKFDVDFVFQIHMVKEVALRVPQVDLLNEEREVVARLNAGKEGELDVSSPSALRNGASRQQGLHLEFVGQPELHAQERYWISPVVIAQDRTSGKDVRVVVEAPLLAERSLDTRKAEVKVQRLKALGWVSLVVAAAFTAALWFFWKIGKRESWLKVRSFLKMVLIRPLRFWLVGFLALSLILLIIGWKYISFSWALCGLLVAMIVLLSLRNVELISRRDREQISRVDILVSCFDAILVPLISILLALLSS